VLHEFRLHCLGWNRSLFTRTPNQRSYPKPDLRFAFPPKTNSGYLLQNLGLRVFLAHLTPHKLNLELANTHTDQIYGPHSLHSQQLRFTSGLWLPNSSFLRSAPFPELDIKCHMLFLIDGCDLHRNFNVQEFQTLQNLFSLKYLYSELQIKRHTCMNVV